MTDTRPDDVERFESALQEWGSRPPRTAAAFAATRVAASLPTRRAAVYRRPLFAAVALLLLVAVLWLIPSHQSPRVADNGLAAAPLDDNVVLWWLDDGTPVYFVLGTTGEGQEGAS